MHAIPFLLAKHDAELDRVQPLLNSRKLTDEEIALVSGGSVTHTFTYNRKGTNTDYSQD